MFSIHIADEDNLEMKKREDEFNDFIFHKNLDHSHFGKFLLNETGKCPHQTTDALLKRIFRTYYLSYIKDNLTPEKKSFWVTDDLELKRENEFDEFIDENKLDHSHFIQFLLNEEDRIFKNETLQNLKYRILHDYDLPYVKEGLVRTLKTKSSSSYKFEHQLF